MIDTVLAEAITVSRMEEEESHICKKKRERERERTSLQHGRPTKAEFLYGSSSRSLDYCLQINVNEGES